MKKIDDTNWRLLKVSLTNSSQIPSFKLEDSDKEYVYSRGEDILKLHATDFVRKRLASAKPKNDGRQTPTKGHPVFVAQHATGTSDRGRLNTFHGIKDGVALTDEEIDYVVDIILRWIKEQAGEPA